GAACDVERREPAERADAERDGRPGDARAHPAVRDGVPHAAERAGADRPRARARTRASDVRTGGREAGDVRALRDDGAAAHRARRALRAGLPPRVGLAREPPGTLSGPVPR